MDLFGLPADYGTIGALAAKHGVTVIEDAAQSFGAEYNGKKAGALAPLACTSFFPAKPLGAYGDGGMCFLRRPPGRGDPLDPRSRPGKGPVRQRPDRDKRKAGYAPGGRPSRQAAAIRGRDPAAPGGGRTATRSCSAAPNRRSSARWFRRAFSRPGPQYSVLARNGAERSALRAGLAQAGIPTAVYYPKPLHLQPAFACLGYREGDFPASEECANRIFSLPMHPYLDRAQQERIAEILLSPSLA